MKCHPFSIFHVRAHIKLKIFVSFAILTLIAMLTVTALWYSYIVSNTREMAVANVTDMIIQSNNKLNELLDDVKKTNQIISTNEESITNVLMSPATPPSYEWFHGYKSATSFLNSIYYYVSSHVSGIAVLDLYGKEYSAGSVWVEDDMLSSDWIADLRNVEGKQLIHRRRFEDYYKQNSEDLITFGRAVISNGKCVGYVITDIKYSVLGRMFDLKSIPGSQMLVIDSDGIILYSSSEIGQNANVSSTEYASLYTKSGSDGSYVNFHGQRCLLVVYRSQESGFTTLAIIPHDSLFRNESTIRTNTVITLILVLVAVMLASMLLSNQITKNLNILNENIKSVSRGELDHISPVDSPDEVGQLSRAFDAMVGKLKSMLNDIRENEKQKRILEIKMLQTQISPHFLCNTLNTMNYLAQLQNADNIRELSSSLVDLLRVSLWSDDVFISIADELKYTESYLNIQKYKYLQGFTVEYDVDESLLMFRTIKLVLQPIVENALIHGIQHMISDGHIVIHITESDGDIVMSVTDNGCGMTREQIDAILGSERNENKLRFSGIGLSNVDERIHLRFGEKYGIRIYSQVGLYTTVEIHLPMIREGGEQLYD